MDRLFFCLAERVASLFAVVSHHLVVFRCGQFADSSIRVAVILDAEALAASSGRACGLQPLSSIKRQGRLGGVAGAIWRVFC